MTDFSLSSKALLIRQMNARYDAFFKLDDIDFINLAVINSDGYNTQITAVATDEGDYRDSAIFRYNRVPLSEVIPEPVIFMSAGGIRTSTDIITRLNANFGLALATDDIIVEDVTIGNITTTIGTYTLKAADTSLMYIDTLAIYFGDESTIRNWLKVGDIQYQSDGSSFVLSGKHRFNGSDFVIGKKGTFSPAVDDAGILLGNDGQFTLTNSAVTPEMGAVRFRGGKLLEILGASGETSYDSGNNCLPVVPRLPSVLKGLLKRFSYSGALNSGLMRFSTAVNLRNWTFPFGVTYYVDSINGNDGNTGEKDKPFKSINTALEKSPIADTIYVSGNGGFVSNKINDRAVNIIGVDSTATLNGKLNVPSWSLYSDSTTTYQYLYTGTGIAGVFDYSVLDDNGLPKRLTLQAGPAEVVANPGSYHLSSTALLIQTSNSRKPDSDIRIVLSGSGLTVTGKSRVAISNLTIEDTDVGVIAESVQLDAKPTLIATDMTVVGTFANACLSNYGANVYTQDCKFSNGFLCGTLHDKDRQTIPLGVTAEFLEISATVQNILAGGVSKCRGSIASGGALGIRFQSTYKTINGYPIEEYGTGTNVAHFETLASDNKDPGALTGALYASGKENVGNNVYGLSGQFLYSCNSDNGSRVGLMSYGSGEIHLYNTPVGQYAQITKPNPYKFIYTSSQITDYESV